MQSLTSGIFNKMTKPNQNILLFLFITAVVLAAVYFVVKKFLNKANENVNDGLSTLTNDYVRTVAAKKAQREIDKMLFLNYPWCVRAEKKYNKSPYKFPNFIGTTGATEVVNEILDSNSLVPGGIFDDSQRALSAILRINSQADAAECTIAYYNTRKKNLSAGLEWLSSEAIIAARDHFKSLPTGVYLGNNELLEVTA